MATPTPITAFTPVFKPLTQITPFTFRDGYTFLEMYSELRQYLVKLLGPEIDAKLTLIYTETQAMVNALAEDINATKLSWQELFDEFMLNIIDELEALNDQAMANLVANAQSLTRIQLDRIYGLVYNVREYGADNTGVTDSQAAVQAAVTAMNGLPGVLAFPAGEYRWKNAIQLHSGVHVMGLGATLAKRSVVAGGNASFFSLLSGDKRGYGSGGENITFTGLKVEGNLSIGQPAALLAAHHGSKILVENCEFNGCMVYGHIADLQGCDGVIFRNCAFRGQLANPSYVYLECVQLDNSTLKGASVPDNPMGYDGLPTINVLLENCKFLPYTVDGVTHPAPNPIGSHAAIEGQYTRNIHVLGCEIEVGQKQVNGTNKGIIHLLSGADIYVRGNVFNNPDGVAVSAVAVRSTAAGAQPGNAGLAEPPTIVWGVPLVPKNINVTDNVFNGFNSTEGYESVLYVYGHSTLMGDGFNAHRNVFRNSRGGEITDSLGGELIFSRYMDNFNVGSNDADESRRAVTFSDCGDVEVIRNKFRNGSGGGGGVINGSNSRSATLEANKVRGFNNYAYYMANITDLKMSRDIASDSVAVNGVGVAINGCHGVSVGDTSIREVPNGITVYGASTDGRVKNNHYVGPGVGVDINADSPTVGSVDNY